MMVHIRRSVQILILLLFVVLFIRTRFPYDSAIQSDLLLRFSPLIPVFEFISDLNVSLIFWPALVILLLTPLLGRFFCGWLCPLGTTLDAAGKLIDLSANKRTSQTDRFRYFKFAVLLFCIILAIFGVNIWSFLDPLAIFNRVLTVTIYPTITVFTEQGFFFLSDFSFLEDPVYFIYDLYKKYIMPEEQAYLQQVLLISVFFLLIIGTEKLSRRFWCRNVCPAGALLGFLSQFRLYERIVGKECPACNKCQQECKMNAIPETDIAYTNKIECIECFNCGAVCPPKTKSITYRWRWSPYHTPVDFERRQFINTSVASLFALGLFSIGLKNRADKSKLIRPPGALPEDNFLEKCIRCQACVRICASNGRCLQPDSIHNAVSELWAPVAVMREGYCEYNCILCGVVCPTKAILPLSVAQKHKVPIGLAYFDKNICIPFAEHRDCIVCEEHCPTSDKAIKFEIKDKIFPDGTQRMVKYPYVRRDLCIGCGICETKCPLADIPGIFITTENQQRLQALPQS